jgi:hypothetical protein
LKGCDTTLHQFPRHAWKEDPWFNAHDNTTITPADDFDEVQSIIELARQKDGIPDARKHTITYNMVDGDEVTEKVTSELFPLASFTVAVEHKEDESVAIVVTIDNGVVSKTRHWIERIFS